MSAYTVGSLFAGIGGIDLAFEHAGFTTAWQVEKEPYCLQVLAKNFPSATRYSDIFECHDLPYVDVITAGFPCQPFSVAGNRRGVDDERYLVPEMLRVISEVKPRVLFLENVPGFASLNDGAVFRELLRLLAEMGFDAQWGRVRASDVGAPHRRERWFCVAYANSGRRRQRDTGKRGVQVSDARGAMAYTNGAGLEKQRTRTISASQAFTRSTINCADARTDTIGGRPTETQSGVGRDDHGFSSGLDGHRFPAAPGCAQYDYEPPRVCESAPHRNARLRALGNAVVPQAVYPIALAIQECLSEQDAQ